MKFCERPFRFAYLRYGGEVWPCGWMHYVIGNLYEQNLDEIWHSEAAQKARESILDGSFAYCRKTSCPFCERGELPDLTEEEIQERAVPSALPVDITIANDRTCNLACNKCRDGIYRTTPDEREKIDAVMEKLLPFVNQAEHVDMNGAGEFLAIPSYMKLLENLHPERPDFTINFETNGTLFDEAHWNRFSHLGQYPITMTVTLDSLNREVYRYLSGGFDYLEQELKNIRFLSKLRRENIVNRLSLSIVVQECNFWEIPEYIRTFAQSEEYAIDRIVMKPLYSWWGMDREKYWFKDILNPLHPYHQAYLKILADDCWNDPKVYDWGCHNIREPRPHPLAQTKRLNDIYIYIYANDTGLSPEAFLKSRLEHFGVKRLGVYGENEHYEKLVQLLRDAGAEVAFRLTRYEDAEGEIPTISMPNLRPDSVDTILLLELYDAQNRTNNLRALKFEGNILTLEELIEG